MTDKVRLEVVVNAKPDENAGDVGVRAKRLLLGMEKEPFDGVQIRRFEEEKND